MASFLEGQLDFILFFYGFAFIVLSGVCFIVAAGGGRRRHAAVLGVFALLHGGGEWLDLIALLVGDTAAFAVARTALMAISYAYLLEFPRRAAAARGVNVPGAWVHGALLLAVALVGASLGLPAANAAARYSIGFIGAAATAMTFARGARREAGPLKRLSYLLACGFAAYSVAGGLIVPAAPFWPASIVNYAWFTRTTGVPIQLIRALLACWIAATGWAMWKRMLATDVASARFTASMRQLLMQTLFAMFTIMGLGWVLTNVLGGIYRESVERGSLGAIDLLTSRIERQTGALDAMAVTLAGNPSVVARLVGAQRADDAPAGAALDLHVAASGASVGFIVDRSRAVIAASAAGVRAPPTMDAVGPDPCVDRAMMGVACGRLAHGTRAAGRDYEAGYPVRGADGAVVGAVVLAMSLDGFAADLRAYNRAYFVVDADGIVVRTNRPEWSERRLWPEDPQGSHMDAAAGARPPMLDREVKDATWLKIGGEADFVRRRPLRDGSSSMVLAIPGTPAVATRFLGIIITLVMTVVAMVHLYGRERLIRDRIGMEDHLKLQGDADDLRVRANTDVLTGLFNRQKMDELLALEIALAKRYRLALSLVLFDIDYFKAVNDRFGHPVGDRVLVQLSTLASRFVRDADVLARWGGEEFVLLAPGTDENKAHRAAERLRVAIASAVFEGVGTMSCSFGVAQYVDGETAEALFARADAALYRAKFDGRNRVESASRLRVAAEPLPA